MRKHMNDLFILLKFILSSFSNSHQNLAKIKIMMHSVGSPFVVDVAPPPSYDQAIDASSTFANPTTIPMPIHQNGIELSEKMVAQSEVIREQEAEIGKLKRDLGRMKEQLERIAKGGKGGGELVPDKLSQRLAAAVGEEAEEQRQKNRSRKGDILRGTLCCIALLAVLLLGIYIVLSRPNTNVKTMPISTSTNMPIKSTTKMPTNSKSTPKLENFKLIGKAIGDNLCWAQGLVHPSGQIMECHIFRRSLDDRRLFCEFTLKNDGKEQNEHSSVIVRGASWRTRSRRKGMIVIRDWRRNSRKEDVEHVDGHTNNNNVEHILLHTLNEKEAIEARKMCTELALPRLMRPTTFSIGQERMGRAWRQWMGATERRWQQLRRGLQP